MSESRKCFIEDKFISVESCEGYKAMNDISACDGCDYLESNITENKATGNDLESVKKNTLIDLNNHLFTQMDKLSCADTSAKLSQEIERSRAMGTVAKNIIDNARLALEAQKELGKNVKILPAMIRDDNG